MAAGGIFSSTFSSSLPALPSASSPLLTSSVSPSINTSMPPGLGSSSPPRTSSPSSSSSSSSSSSPSSSSSSSTSSHGSHGSHSSHSKHGGRGERRRKDHRHSATVHSKLVQQQSVRAETYPSVLCWGGPENISLNTPERVLVTKNVTQVCTGREHVVFLTRSGHVYVAGKNASGQLGVPDEHTVSLKTPIRLSAPERVRTVCAGMAQSAAITMDGDLYAWGLLNEQSQMTPKLFFDFKSKGRVQNVVFGQRHVCVLLLNFYHRSELWVWGSSLDGCLGLRDVTSCQVPHLVEELAGQEITQVAAGEAHMAALSVSGLVYMWGSNADGMLGIGAPTPVVSIPSPLDVVPLRFSQIACGLRFTLGLERDGHVYSWGKCKTGCLGNSPTTSSLSIPARLPHLSAVRGIVTSPSHCFAWTEDSVFSWGRNTRGRLGHSADVRDVWVPHMVPFFQGKNVLQVALGHDFSFVRIVRHYVSIHYHPPSSETVAISTPIPIPPSPSPSPSSLPHSSSSSSSSSSPAITSSLFTSSSPSTPSPPPITSSNPNVSLTPSALSPPSTRNRSLSSESPPNIQIINLEKTSTAADLIRRVSPIWGLDPEDHCLVDCFGASVKPDVALQGFLGFRPNRSFFITRIKNFWDLEKDKELGFASNMPIEQRTARNPPEIKFATVPQLIEWLTHPCYTGDAFRHIFFLSYKSIGLASIELLRLLISRFDENDIGITGRDLPAQAAGTLGTMVYNGIKVRVMEVLAFWIEQRPNDFLLPDSESASLATKVVKFVRKKVAPGFPAFADQLDRLLFVHLDPLKLERHAMSAETPPDQGLLPPPEPPLRPGELSIFAYSPREIARQITFIDFYHYFRRIDLAEFSGQGWTKKDKYLRSPNILRSANRFNNLSEWVVAEILKADTHMLRVKTTETFIEIANELLMLLNFDSLLAVLSAFEAVPVARLRSLWSRAKQSGLKGVSKAAHQKLQHLRQVCNRENNRAVIRSNMKSAPYPKIPFMALYLSDIFFTGELKDTVEGTNQAINWTKCSLHTRFLDEIKACQDAPYKITVVPELSKWLSGVRGLADHKNSSMQLSKSIDLPAHAAAGGAAGTASPSTAVLHATLAASTTESDYLPDLSASPSEVSLNLDVEVEFINSRCQVVFSNYTMFERSTLWKTWRRDLAEKESFHTVLLRSRAIELTAVSIIDHPLNPLERREVEQLFLAVFLDASVVARLLELFSFFSQSRLSSVHRTAVQKLIRFLQPSNFDRQHFTLASAERMAAEQTRLKEVASYIREISRSLQESGSSGPTKTNPKIVSDLLQRLPELSNSNEFFRDYLTLLYSLHAENQGSDWTPEAAAQLSELMNYISHIKERTQQKIDELRAESARIQAEAEETQQRLQAEERKLLEEKQLLLQEKEELEKRLKAIQRNLKSKNRKLEEVAARVKRRRKEAQDSQQKLSKKQLQEQNFLETGASSSAATYASLTEFVARVHEPMRVGREGRSKAIKEELLHANYGYLCSISTSLDFELSLSSAALKLFLEVRGRASSHVEDLLAAHIPITPECLASFSPLEERQMQVLDESWARTHKIHFDFLEKTKALEAHPAAMSPELSSLISIISSKLSALDDLHSKSGCIPPLSSFVLSSASSSS